MYCITTGLTHHAPYMNVWSSCSKHAVDVFNAYSVLPNSFSSLLSIHLINSINVYIIWCLFNDKSVFASVPLTWGVPFHSIQRHQHITRNCLTNLLIWPNYLPSLALSYLFFFYFFRTFTVTRLMLERNSSSE